MASYTIANDNRITEQDLRNAYNRAKESEMRVSGRYSAPWMRVPCLFFSADLKEVTSHGMFSRTHRGSARDLGRE